MFPVFERGGGLLTIVFAFSFQRRRAAHAPDLHTRTRSNSLRGERLFAVAYGTVRAPSQRFAWPTVKRPTHVPAVDLTTRIREKKNYRARAFAIIDSLPL